MFTEVLNIPVWAPHLALVLVAHPVEDGGLLPENPGVERGAGAGLAAGGGGAGGGGGGGRPGHHSPLPLPLTLVPVNINNLLPTLFQQLSSSVKMTYDASKLIIATRVSDSNQFQAHPDLGF